MPPLHPFAVEILARNWWAVLLRGIAAALFGLLTLLAPALSLAALVLVFGAYAFVDGVLALVSVVRGRAGGPWWAVVLEGLAGVAAGVVTLLWPGITVLALLYLVAAWAFVTGVLEVAAAVRLREVIEGEWLLALSGVASIALGVLLALFPGPGAVALVIWIGAWALVSGVLMTALGVRLRRHAGTLVRREIRIHAESLAEREDHQRAG
jgi:uncharacterized membrane protein HdeD (DUF308 family)